MLMLLFDFPLRPCKSLNRCEKTIKAASHALYLLPLPRSIRHIRTSGPIPLRQALVTRLLRVQDVKLSRRPHYLTLIAPPLRLHSFILASPTLCLILPRPASTTRRSVRVPDQHLLLCTSTRVLRPAHVVDVSLDLRKISLFQIIAFRLQGPLWQEMSKSGRRRFGDRVGSVFFA